MKLFVSERPIYSDATRNNAPPMNGPMTMPKFDAITILPSDVPLLFGAHESITRASLTGHTIALATP